MPVFRVLLVSGFGWISGFARFGFLRDFVFGCVWFDCVLLDYDFGLTCVVLNLGV